MTRYILIFRINGNRNWLSFNSLLSALDKFTQIYETADFASVIDVAGRVRAIKGEP